MHELTLGRYPLEGAPVPSRTVRAAARLEYAGDGTCTLLRALGERAMPAICRHSRGGKGQGCHAAGREGLAVRMLKGTISD